MSQLDLILRLDPLFDTERVGTELRKIEGCTRTLLAIVGEYVGCRIPIRRSIGLPGSCHIGEIDRRKIALNKGALAIALNPDLTQG